MIQPELNVSLQLKMLYVKDALRQFKIDHVRKFSRPSPVIISISNIIGICGIEFRVKFLFFNVLSKSTLTKSSVCKNKIRLSLFSSEGEISSQSLSSQRQISRLHSLWHIPSESVLLHFSGQFCLRAFL